MIKRFIIKIRRYFLTGILALLPTIVVILLVFRLVAPIDEFVLSKLAEIPRLSFLAKIPGLGLIITTGLIILVGLFTTNFIGRRIAEYWGNLIARIPLLSKIYVTVKQILDAFVGAQNRRSVFREVVLVEYPRPGIYAVGFITSQSDGEIKRKLGDDMVHVFIPTTPNPTSGFLAVVPRSQLTLLNMRIEEGLKLIISGGVFIPEHEEERKLGSQT